jgi:hypothetical protein
MPSYISLLLTLFLSSGYCYSQTKLVGQVVDALTKEPLPFVNIGLVNENIGTVSDEQGYFILELDAERYSQSN